MKYLPGLHAIAALLFAMMAAGVSAQDYPAKPIRVVVPSTPGGSIDISARLIARKLEERFKSPVLVENRAGGNTMVGSLYVVNAAPDGYTLLINAPSFISRALYKDPPFDVLKALTPVGPVYAGRPLAFVISSALPVKNVAEFVAYAKANAGKLNYSTAQGTTTLLMEAFKQLAGISIAKIEYKGSSQSITALMADEVQASFSNPSSATQQAKAGKVRIIAVAGDKRMNNLPDVPTMPELGYPKLTASILMVLFAPAGVPAGVVNKLYPAVRDAVAGPEFEKAFDDAATPLLVDNAELNRLIREEIEAYLDVGRIANYQPQ